MNYPIFCIRVVFGCVFIAMLAIAGMVSGCAGWSQQEKAGQAVYTALHVADWAQTRQIAAHPEEFHETNPVIGKHPSKGQVDLYMGATLAAHYVVSNILPSKWTVPLIRTRIRPRSMWQYFSIGIEAGCVANNYSLGIEGEF